MGECSNLFKETKTAGFKRVPREQLDDAQQNKRYHIFCLPFLASARQL